MKEATDALSKLLDLKLPISEDEANNITKKAVSTIMEKFNHSQSLFKKFSVEHTWALKFKVELAKVNAQFLHILSLRVKSS